MIKISFLNEKGGVGKTTSVVNVAAVLTKNMKKKVLVLDCDKQCNATNYLLSFYEKKDYPTIQDVIEGRVAIEDAIIECPIKYKGKIIDMSNLFIIPSSPDLAGVLMPDVQAMRRLLEPVEKIYHYCLVDMPPQFSGPSMRSVSSADEQQDSTQCGVALCALIASDYVIVPAYPNRFSISRYNALIESVKTIRYKKWNLALKLLGIFFTNVNSRRGLDSYVVETGQEGIANAFSHTIKSESIVAQAEWFGIPLPYFSGAGKSEAAKDYQLLTVEMLSVIKKMSSEK